LNQQKETVRFVKRALLDFGLIEQFEARPSSEQAECLWWIAAAPDSSEEDARVARLLDDLAAGRPLPSRDLSSRPTGSGR